MSDCGARPVSGRVRVSEFGAFDEAAAMALQCFSFREECGTADARETTMSGRGGRVEVLPRALGGSTRGLRVYWVLGVALAERCMCRAWELARAPTVTPRPRMAECCSALPGHVVTLEGLANVTLPMPRSCPSECAS